jgi:hypothetical protein
MVLATSLWGSFAALPARAAIETDPEVLYQTMRRAYDEGAGKGWPFASELYYQSTVFDAGRAYSLFRPDDAQYGEVAILTVDVATQLHYNPLVNNDAALWYVLEASDWVSKNADVQHVAEAKALLQRTSAGENDPNFLAQQAEQDALANAADFHRDGDALVELIVTDVRAYNLTHDAQYRSLLLDHAADPTLPLVRVPDPESTEMFSIAERALTEAGFSEADRANARTIKYRRDHTPELKLIGRVSAIPRELRLTRTAPADEYFGNLKMSPLGVHNEVVRINKYLDVGWGAQMASDALQLDSSVEDWQKQYPHDFTLPRNLLDLYKLLMRVATPTTREAATRVKYLLLVQYANSPQAQELSAS